MNTVKFRRANIHHSYGTSFFQIEKSSVVSPNNTTITTFYNIMPNINTICMGTIGNPQQAARRKRMKSPIV